MWTLYLTITIGSIVVGEMETPFDTRPDCWRALGQHGLASDLLDGRGLKYKIKGECIFEQPI